MGARLSYPEVDLAGKVAVVTGGNTGIGYETSKALAVMGAHTIIACRSQERAAGAIARMKEEVEREHPDRQIMVEFMPLDLASFQSVKEFTVAFQEKNLPLHFLINNAGIFATPLNKTGDGYESQFQVNHLSHFLLTLELLPVILTTASACGDCRIVFVASSGHSLCHWEPANMNAELSYDRMKFYSYSKLYNVMSGYALQRRLQDVGVTVSSMNPGFTDTEVFRNVSDRRMLSLLFRAINVFKRTAKQGAATAIDCAVNPQLNSQQCFYYDSCAPKQSSPDSRNEQFQEDLWRRSVDIVKEFLSPEALERYGHSSSEQGEQREEEEEEGERRAEEGGEETERQEERRGEGEEEVKGEEEEESQRKELEVDEPERVKVEGQMNSDKPYIL